MPQLDGLRAIAVFGVFVTHFLPPENKIRAAWGWGGAGVHLFFVLSGFLITNILLRCRKFEAGETPSIVWSLRQFYARRFLRIFPLYYLIIVLCVVFDLGQLRQSWAWHVTYLSNVGMVIYDGGFGRSTHFWTLAVEEQFYIVWPLLILLTPERWLPRLLVASIVFAPVFRLVMSMLPIPWLARAILTPACLDTLAAGALLAWLWDSPTRDRIRIWIGYCGVSFGVGVFACLTCLPLSVRITSAGSVLLSNLAYAGIFFFVVDCAARGIHGPVGNFLASRPLTYFGRISYGLYIIHHFTIDISARCGLDPYWGNDLIRFLALSIMTVVLATMSWFLFENPLNSFKAYFPYQKQLVETR